jgi:hypothetical protein
MSQPRIRCYCGGQLRFTPEHGLHCDKDHAPVTPAPPEASHRALREWQPIETAPKDGTQVWAWDAERGSNPALWVDGAWWITYDDAMIHPTHWMPLPDPPAALSTGTETQEPQSK